MSNCVSKLILCMALLAVAFSSVPAEATTYYFPTGGSTAYIWDVARWNTNPGGGGTNPTVQDFADISNKFIIDNKQVLIANNSVNPATGFTFAAPVTYTGSLAVSGTNLTNPSFYFNGIVSNTGNLTYNFSDLRFTGTMHGPTTRGPRLAGKVTLTGDLVFQFRTTQTIEIDALLDGSAASTILNAYYLRADAATASPNIRLNNSGNYFYGTWLLDARLEGRVAGSLGEGDITINGGSSADYRAGKLAVSYVAGAISPSAVMKVYTATGNNTDPCRLDLGAINATVRELWIDDVQQTGSNITFSTANATWISGTGVLTVTNAATQTLTMAIDPAGDPNMKVYPPAGSSRAYSQGHSVKIYAPNPTTSPYTFDHWTSSISGAIADESAASTTVTIPTGSDITVTAHYVIAAASPVPLTGATNVSVFTGLSWIPATGVSQEIYFGTDNPPLTQVASGVGVSSVSNAALGGPLAAGTQYFWRVVSNGQAGPLWYFTTGNPQAHDPSPASGAIEIDPNSPTLAWLADSAGAVSYDVYMSTDQTAVTNGTAPKTVVTSPTLAISGMLARATRYYWRVDCNYTGGLVVTGNVWNFKTKTYKLYLKTAIPAYSIDGAPDVNAAVFDDPNIALYSFPTFNYGSDWDVIVTGTKAVAIWSDSGITFGGILDVSGADGLVAGTGSGAGVGIAGGFNGGNNSQSVYTDSVNGPGHGNTAEDMRDGSGGAFGGDGGRCGRYSTVLHGEGGIAYGQPELYTFIGGSGGGGGGRAGGGAGGGAIELYARSGDISIQSSAAIKSNGGSNNNPSDYPGGGGSGGAIRLIASGNVNIAGTISANGGQGGSTGQVKPADTGGGGGGGRIAIFTGGTYSNVGTVTAGGGATGLDGSTPPSSWARAGGDGTVYTAGKTSTLLKAHNPIPANGNMMWSIEDANNLRLSWAPALGSVENKLYFGTSQASLTLQTTITDPNGMRSQKVYPVALTAGKKYYWRVDCDGSAGPVWSFGTGTCSSPTGDLNGDCKVTFADFALVAAKWKTCNLFPVTDCSL